MAANISFSADTQQPRLGRRRIPIQFITDRNRRQITFSKRKAGIMKKAFELSILTGTEVLLLITSETGHIYTFASPKFRNLIKCSHGRDLIQACLNASANNPTAFNTSSSSSQFWDQTTPDEDSAQFSTASSSACSDDPAATSQPTPLPIAPALPERAPVVSSSDLFSAPPLQPTPAHFVSSTPSDQLSVGAEQPVQALSEFLTFRLASL